MKSLANTLTIVGAGLFLGGNLWAVIPDKYQTILDRNAFGLVPPPEIAVTNKPVEPPANLKVTGFATIAGERRVYFTIPAKDPSKELQQYLSLSEGQREGSLEVVSISDATGEVSIRNGNVDMTLSLKKDGFQPAKLAPGVNQAPMPLGPPPGAQASSPVYSPESAGGVVSGQPYPPNPQGNGVPNQLSPEQMNQQQMNMQQNGSGNVQPSGAIRTIPTRTLRVPPVQPTNPGPQSSANNLNSVVYNPNPGRGGNNNNGNTSGEGAVDPALQLALMQEYQAEADRNGGYVPIEVPTRGNSAVARPATSTQYVPAPPMPPIPQ